MSGALPEALIVSNFLREGPMRNLRYILPVLVVLGTSACESDVSVRGTVTVGTALVKMFSQEKQARVVIEVKLQNLAGAVSIGGLCGGEEPVRLPFGFSKFGCATEGTVTAWVEPVEPGSVPANECGPHYQGWGRPKPAQPIREAKAMVFTGKTKCDDGGEMHGVELFLE